MPEDSKSVSMATKIKEVFGAMREGVIVIAVIGLLFNPSWIGKIAQEAGLKSAFGMEFIEQQLEESQAETASAQEEVDRIMSELTEVKGQLGELSVATLQARPEVRNKINTITANVGTLEERSRTINKSLESSLNRQKTILEMRRR